MEASTPLSDLCRELGGVLAPEPLGSRALASWGDEPAEYEALRRDCGLVVRSERAPLVLTGEDRQRFLNGLVTCDVKEIAAAGGRYGFLTDIHGKILADAAVLAAGESLLLELPATRVEAVVAHLEKYRIADRVEFARPAGRVVLLLAGPSATEAAAEILGQAPPREEWAHGTASGDEGELRVYRDGRWSCPAYGVIASVETAAALLRRGAEGRLATARPVGWRALETMRVEDGVPLYGVEYADDAFPQETGIESAVSYEKGCYLGQEVIARIHYRGKVNRLLRGLRLGRGEPPSSGTEVSFEGRSAGTLGGVVRSPREDGPIALLLLHRRAAEPGTSVEVAGGGAAEVVELPFG